MNSRIGDQSKSVEIKTLLCISYHHTAAITETGELCTWGQMRELRPPPVPVAAVCPSRADDVDKGKLYMWGNAKDSQLGVPGLREIQPCPVEVKFLMEDDGLGAHNVLSAAIGATHDSMCLVSR
ncbi:hypothetical protein LWI29_029404 [Acer saccharum]|uniref:Uncharacterized protein n=1 Tax=Acer saccharum TaxID=4024 RepID=A0AA39VN91_ACESA|nr:hypothetical protein LWI29_029404 [Acer saccharum]